jgi:hypothetical protein
MFLNRYECSRCDCAWSDVLTCEADDNCPACGLRHIAPEDSFAFDDGCDVAQQEAA